MAHTANMCVRFAPLIAFVLAASAFAQEEGTQEPDTILFNNGERLAGKFLRSTGGSLQFHSDSIGDITIDWKKVKELKTSGEYAVISKGTNIKRADMDSIPQGTLLVTDGRVELNRKGNGNVSVPVETAGEIVDEQLFNSTLSTSAGLFHKWTGAVTAAAALVQATQVSRTYNGSIHLVRALPAETFLERESRSNVNLTGSFGTTRQPGFPTVRTEILHADAEHDLYFSPRTYSFGQAAFDHNFSQGLDLQQTYGLGIGVTVIKQPDEELNLKASAGFERQQFAPGMTVLPTGGTSQDLFGSIFAATYMRKLGKAHAAILTQNLQISPAWTNLQAYSGVGSSTLTTPIYKRMNFTIGVADSFVNNPPVGFRKNSFQATTGITYTLK